MAKPSKNSSGTFVTNDWRHLNANAPEALLISDDMVDEKNGLTEATGLRIIAQDNALMKHEFQTIKAAVFDLQKDRDNLRTAIRKLKVENSRIKAKLKRVGDAVKGHTGLGETMDIDNLEDDVEYEDLKQFALVGGPKDPFGLQFTDAPIEDTKDSARTKYKTGERYYWYKMAQFFEDKEAMQKILDAEDSRKAEESVKEVKNFDQPKWDAVKLKFWEEAQRLKFEQHRWIRNLLIKSGSTYIAVASQDKTVGTGWRKQREEASRTQLWDGENNGGKILMKLREEYGLNHAWTNPQEEQDALSKFNEFKRSIWKPYGPAVRTSRMRGGGIDGARLGVARMTVTPAAMFPPPQMQARPPGPKAAPKKRRQI